jgi:hypothetical protein
MGEAMRDIAIMVAGLLGVVVGCIHGVLGETRLFARGRIEPAYVRRMVRLGWQCGATAWSGIGILLIGVPSFQSDVARHYVIAVSAMIYGFGAFANARGTGGRHFGWVMLVVIIALASLGW